MCFLGCVLLTACTNATKDATSFDSPKTTGVSEGTSEPLLSIPTLWDQPWQHLAMRGETDYRVVSIEGQLAIRAQGRESASGLGREVDVDLKHCPEVGWTWRMEVLQASANIGDRNRDDVAASVGFMFGDPGFLGAPTPVPSIRYVWTNDRYPPETVLPNPYYPQHVKNIVLRSGESHAGQWLQERRNLVADYEQAFGQPPAGRLYAMVLFSDNDQTGEPVIAYYRDVWSHCKA